MPAEVAAPAADPNARNARGGEQSSMLWTVMRIGLMWMAMSYFGGNKSKTAPGGSADRNPTAYSFPAFKKHQPVDFYCFLSERTNIRTYDMEELIWKVQDVELGGEGKINTTVKYHPSQAVQHNSSLYLHVLFAKAGMPINPNDPDYDESVVFGRIHNLIAFHKEPKNHTMVNLLSGELNTIAAQEAAKEKERAAEAKRKIISFFKPNISIQVVDHFQVYPKAQIPPQVGPWMQFDEGGNYFPIIHFNEFWLLKEYLVPMNETVENVTLFLEFETASMWYWQLILQMDKSFAMQTDMGMTQEGESDEVKRVFLEGNPYLLVLTFFVSLLHTVFDVLAFKNDIGFWKNNKSMEGLSARSIMINAVCQLIILLYLFDNETSYVVLFSSVLGTAIEFWKVTKAMDVKVDMTKFPYISFHDRVSYSENKTKQYDAEAMRYLSYVLYPLVGGYAIYALIYKSHKSWWSWIINSLVSAVYMFGFILMCPQLYLNYKLKSVAHLPWRQMTYKFLNTIIDDLFAFVIKMPLLHRLSVFRDDVIFCIFLYQRWIYRVDRTRVNEFGWGGEEPTEEEKVAALEGKEEVAAITDKEEPAGDGVPRKRAGKGDASEASTAKAEATGSVADAGAEKKKAK